MRRVLVGLLSLSLLTAACGDDDDAAERATTTTADDDTPTGDDTAVAEAAVLQLSDFPDGWQQQPEEDDVDDTESEQRIADCIGVDHERLYGDGDEAESPTFVSPDGREVSNTAGLEESADEAQFQFEILTSQKAIDCIAEEFQRFLEDSDQTEGAEIGQISIDPVPFEGHGDESAAFRVAIPIEAEGTSVDAYVDIALARVGRGGVTVQALSLFEPFDAEQLAGYTDLLVERLSDALEG